MRGLIIIVAMSALVLAKPKPETYKETEDFQYSRSSSDDGHKAGFYGAQRGNMGGNYERAHNMDVLAQHQMSGLVRQVDGELGEGSKTRTGSVYTAANSRGIYGSGNYDLSNLQGRNFEEGESSGNSQSLSSLTSQNTGYRGHLYTGINSGGFSSSSRQAQQSRYSGYQSSGHEDQRHTDNLLSVGTSQGVGKYEDDKNRYISYGQYGAQGQSEFDQSRTNFHNSANFDANSQSRYVTTPVRVILRPGGRVAIPIAAPTYDVSQTALAEDKNAINTDAELLNQHTNFKPTNKGKHYESSYSYRKQWEKHHTQPGEVSLIVPTETPIPRNRELYDDTQLLQSAKNQFENANLQTVHSNSEHRSNSKSTASSQSKFQSGFNSQQSHSGLNAQQSHTGFNAQQSSGSSDAFANAYEQRGQSSGMTADFTNAAINPESKPKSYHSSYSYHKSWERQGDPYVIKPAGETYEDQSQRLTATTSNSAAYASHQYGSHSNQAKQSYIADCDDKGHLRVPRSYNSEQELQQLQNQWEDLSQQTQNNMEKLEDFGQQSLAKLEDLEDLGQQQQNKWEGLQELEQQTQNQRDNLQQSEQESQNKWDIQQFGQQTQDNFANLEDFGQQSQRDLEQSPSKNLEDISQHSQKEDVLPDFEQQMNGAEIDAIEKSYTQNQHVSNPNIWDQISDFNPKPNIPNADNNFDKSQSVNTHEVTNNYGNEHKFEGLDQSQINLWYPNQDTNSDKNTDSDNFMRPVSEVKDNTEQNVQHNVDITGFNVNNKPNLFPTPSINNNYNRQWDHNNGQDFPWSLNPNHNTNYGTSFWHKNEFNHFHNQYGHDFNSNYFPTADNATPLSSLWDKIDNIAGDFAMSQSNIEEKHFSHDYSNFYPHNHNGYNWGEIPEEPKFELPQINIDKSNDGKSIEHHNLFDEEEQSTSTTSVKPNNIFLSHHSPSPTENTATQPFHRNDNKPSPDIGRGDIGPEETIVETTKNATSNKTPEEIETLSLTKEPHVTETYDIIIQPNSRPNNNENTPPVINLHIQQRPNQNGQHQLFSTLQAQTSTTTSIIYTTPKSNNVFHNNNQKPTLDGLDVSNPSSINQEKQKPQLQTGDSVETLEHTQQQNLDQQSEDFGQQLQSFWLPTDNFQQGYDQQNVEGQFEVSHKNVDDKPYKPSTEIMEPFSLTMETGVNKTPDVDQNNQLSVLTSSNQENQNLNKYVSYSTLQSRIPTTAPTTHGQITTNSNSNLYNVSQKPTTDVTNNPPIDLQKNQWQNQNTDNLEIPEGIQQENLDQQFEDLGQQLQNSWFPSDNMHQGNDQENMEQQFEVFHQNENMNIQDQTALKDFGQQIQSSVQSFDKMPTDSQQFQDTEIQSISNNNAQKFEPPVHPKYTNSEIQQHVDPKYTSYTDTSNNGSSEKINPPNKLLQPHDPKIESLDSPSESNLKIAQSPSETSTENPGFWKSVGNKLSNAKDKVFSWFRS